MYFKVELYTKISFLNIWIVKATVLYIWNNFFVVQRRYKYIRKRISATYVLYIFFKYLHFNLLKSHFNL